MKIEVAMHHSITWTRHRMKCKKGNHRRKNENGDSHSWGFGEYPTHSFSIEEGLSYLANEIFRKLCG